MKAINPLAESLNQIIKNANPSLFKMLSKKGKKIYFPTKGLVAQGIEAAQSEINATIGVALEDDGSPVCLSSIREKIDLPPNQVFPYVTTFGKKDLRTVWQRMLWTKNPSLKGKKISLPVITHALTHGLSIAGYLFVNEGDPIIVPDLFWGNYRLVFSLGLEAPLTFYPFFNGPGLDLGGFRKAVMTGKVGKRILVLNFPNNPTGYTPTIAEAFKIKDILVEAASRGNKLVVILDDAYFGLVFRPGVYEESLLSLLADAHENILAVKVDGATKEDYVWGLRVGFITFGNKLGNDQLYSALEAKTAGAIRGSISNVCHLSQSLLLHAYQVENYQKEKEAKYKLLKTRFERVDAILKSHPEYHSYFQPLPYNSGYFMCLKLVKGEAEPIRQSLLSNFNTGVIAIDNLIRIAFSSTPTGKLEKLFANIYQACAESV